MKETKVSREEIAAKIREFLDGKLSDKQLERWTMERIEYIDQDRSDLMGWVSGHLLSIDDVEWRPVITRELLQYYIDCLIGKEEFDQDVARSL